MAKGSSYAVPATPSRGGDRADYDSTPGTEDLVTTGRSVSFEDTEFDHDTKDEDDYVDDELEDKAPVQEPELHEYADVFVKKCGDVKSLPRNLADEFEEAGKPEPADDDIDELHDDLKKSSTMTRGASQLTTKKDGPPRHTSANSTLNVLEPTVAVETLNVLTRACAGYQYKKMELENPPTDTSELISLSVISWKRFAKDLYDGRIEQLCILSDAERIGKTKQERFDEQSCKILREYKDMLSDETPADEVSRRDRGYCRGIKQDDDENDATTELAWQIRELTAMEEMDPTPRFEIAQHRPLGKITPFRGRLDERENSMQ
ncbi:reverse transcriptase [Phytophthora megakarya]|uniref:Reverse transcriptase n=1 Tax=Phytophthora megakarya TaxID=4795 RepID=A0A225VGD9_9STRA|nr:reverse transcriptase [Phytophthora megakarya]